MQPYSPARHLSANTHNSPTLPRQSGLSLTRPPVDKNTGLPIDVVGWADGQVDNEVPMTLLQSLYLAPCFASVPSPAPLSPETDVAAIDSEASRPPISRSPSTSRMRRAPTLTLEGNRYFASSRDNAYPPVRLLAAHERRRILVTGGAGFVGSHLVDRLLVCGHDVIVADSYLSGRKSSISHWLGHPNFELLRHDVVEPLMCEVDLIYHLACPASPAAYQANAIKTLKTAFTGTLNMLGLAKRVKARCLIASTSEIYGSPQEHPQPGKRVAEALAYGYHCQGVDVRVCRIFKYVPPLRKYDGPANALTSTFGPRMSPTDGRFVSNFMMQALRGDDITIYGDGTQTRSLMFIQDLVDGLMRLMDSPPTSACEPVNLGTEDEATVEEWAHTIVEVAEEVLASAPLELQPTKPHQRSRITYHPAVIDDPPRRRPDITRARQKLGWQPRWSTRDGLVQTAQFLCGRGLHLLDV